MQKNLTSWLSVILSTVLLSYSASAQNVNTTSVQFLPGEYWWGAFTQAGRQMPYVKEMGEKNLDRDNWGNQATAFFLSNKGRYVWSDKPFVFSIKDNTLNIKSDYEKVEVKTGGNTLREAYLAACNAHFPPTGKLPDPLFFSRPQYNTWIELLYDQNQADIMKYAHDIVDNGCR